MHLLFTLSCCDGCRVHDPLSGRSPRPHPDGERTAPPFTHPLKVGVTGVSHRGLICGVSLGDTVSVVCSVAQVVMPGVCRTRGHQTAPQREFWT